MSDTQTNVKIENEENPSISSRQIFVRMLITAFFIFVAGFFITALVAEWVGYKNYPDEGSISVRKDGQEVFNATYPTFRKFVKHSDGAILGKEPTRFDSLGLLGRGLFFYCVANAPHWIMELHFSNTRAIAFIPFLVLLAGSIFLFLQFLPKSMWTKDYTLRYAVSLSVFHALFCVFFLTAAYLISPSFHGLLASPLYVGELLGILFPSLVIILTTSIFLGAVVGWITLPLVYTAEEIKNVLFVPKQL